MLAKEALGDYYKNYSDIYNESESNMSKIYKAYNKIDDRDCILKIIDKNELEKGDYDFHVERLKKEEEITKLCQCENIVNFYRKIENEKYIIFELEDCEQDLNKYLSENGELEREKDLFKKIAQDIAKALKKLQSKGIMHRDIKPSNFFLSEKDDEKTIKLGDFGCAIYKKDNNFDQIGTYLYNAPEVVQNLEYDEKCDLWSLGISLFELYFGFLPYSPQATSNVMLKYLYGDMKWTFRKTKDPNLEPPFTPKKPKDIIPNLDVLFRRLLTLDPKKRMTIDEYYDYVFNQDFMKPGLIAINNNPEYAKIYQEIENEEAPKYNVGIEKESKDDEKIEKKNVGKIINVIGEGHLPDIMNFANGSVNGEQKYNNIIYYDENVTNFKDSVYQDSDLFENHTPGAFILCTNEKSLELVKNEITTQMKRDKNTTFNLITTGSQCEKVMDYLDKNKEFEKCIKNVCVYCMNLQKWSKLKNQYNKVYGVFNTTKDVLNFINQFSKKEIKPFYVTKLITLKDYLAKYKDRHFTISKFYGNLSPEAYKKYIEDIKKIVEAEGKKKELFQSNQNELMSGFFTFDLSKDLEKLDQLIVKEYTKNTFYGDLNKWLMNSKLNFYEPVAYFTARLMYHLNSFAEKKTLYYNADKKELHRGVKLFYSSLLPYERAIGKIILLSAFTSTSQEKQLAERWAGRGQSKTLYKTNKKFSVVFFIKNYHKANWISNGIDVQSISAYSNEKEILYQPFSFYKVRKVEIDYDNYIADIYLETIGKCEILEEKIKLNKQIHFNKDKNIMEAV